MPAQAIPPVRQPGHGEVAVVMTGKLRVLADDFCEDGRSRARDTADEYRIADRLIAEVIAEQRAFKVSQCFPDAHASGYHLARQVEPGRYMRCYS